MLLESVKQYILTLKAGDKLPDEVALAERFHVSRGTIREVTSHLKQLGVLERGTKTGTFLKAPGIAEIAETLSLQLQVAEVGFEELKAMRLFLEIGQIPLIVQLATPQVIDRLRTLVDEMEQVCDEPEKADALDMQFHLALTGICGNRILTIFSQVIVLMFEKKHRKQFLNPAAARKSVRDHRRMIECLRNKDRAQLTTLMEQHLRPI